MAADRSTESGIAHKEQAPSDLDAKKRYPSPRYYWDSGMGSSSAESFALAMPRILQYPCGPHRSTDQGGRGSSTPAEGDIWCHVRSGFRQLPLAHLVPSQSAVICLSYLSRIRRNILTFLQRIQIPGARGRVEVQYSAERPQRGAVCWSIWPLGDAVESFPY